MTRDPWTDPDPQPGDFDADLAAIDPHDVECHYGNPDATLTLVDDAERTENAEHRSRRPSSRRAEPPTRRR